MAPWSVNILLHRGGAFSKEGSLTYDGGNVAVFRNIDKDVMSYFHLVDLAKSVGCKDGDTLFYGIPGRSLDNGIDHIKDDNSVSEMMKYANQTNYLEVYVQHNELHTGGHPTVGDTEQRNPPAHTMAQLPSKIEILVLSLQMRRRRMKLLMALHALFLYWFHVMRKKQLRLIREPCRDTRNVNVKEMVAMFLHIVAYDEKSRNMRTDYQRSIETISRHFNHVLGAVLKLWRVLLRSPQPISDNCDDKRWKWFKNCLGALDGTYIKVRVPAVDKPRYRTRKNDIATNVLVTCTTDMQFVYVLAGCYYLVDAGYRNCEGFLAPYRGQHYHLNEWGNPPRSKEELFNMKHSSARNVVERTIGLLKLRWGIIRNGSHYPIDTQIGIILACCYLHNLIRQQMGSDPIEPQLEAFLESEEEESALVDILLEMTESGWKADTGHKSGYMTYIEKELAKKFPNANIKADPHVMSQVKKLKKLLSYVLDIQSNGSGFGWDDERKMVAGDKELFDGWAKSQNGAANLYMKPFVHYDKLCKIYANDLAKESNAKGPGDEFDFGEEQSVDNTMTEPTQQSESVVESQSHLQCPGSNPSSGNKNSGSRKRKHVDDEAVSFELFNLSKSLTHLVEAETINATAMQVIQSAYDHKLKAQKLTDERREQLYSVVTKFSEFTCDQLVRADRIIGADATTLNMFFTTLEEYKSEYIRQVLESSK
ncbi:hypothetical protein EJB05_13483, partial [Eragrostis curvula]